MKRQTEHWLDKAEEDLILVEEIIDNEYLTNMVAFHSQQAIEKSIKAVLEEKENHVPRIHNIITLKGKIENYIDSRYPTDLGLLPDGKPSKEIAEKFFGIATEIHKNIRGYLSE